VSLDFIGSDEVDSPRLHGTPRVRFLNLRGDQRRNVALARKISRVAVYYARLLRYAAVTPARVFHILWNNKFEHFDRTLLMLYYKLLNKKVVLTLTTSIRGVATRPTASSTASRCEPSIGSSIMCSLTPRR